MRLVADSVRDAVAADDLAPVRGTAQAMLTTPGVRYVRIRRGDSALAEAGDPVALGRPYRRDGQLGRVDDGLFDVDAQIIHRGRVLGRVDLGLAIDGSRRLYTEARNWGLGVSVLLVGLVSVFSFLRDSGMVQRLALLKKAAGAMEDNGPGQRVEVRGNDELAQTAQTFNRMSASLERSSAGTPPADLRVLLLGGSSVLERALREQLGFLGLSLSRLDSPAGLSQAVGSAGGRCLLIVDGIDEGSEAARIFRDAKAQFGKRLCIVRTLGHGASLEAGLGFDGALSKPLAPGRLLPHLVTCGAGGPAEGRQPGGERTDSEESGAGKTPQRILVVEDSYPNQLLITKVLEREGYEVDLAENGKQAMEAVNGNGYDLILMDISMPVMDGLDATRGIRALDGPKSQTTVVALTAHAFTEDRERCLEAGMDDYLSKPVNIPEMLKCIRRWLAGARERQQARKEEERATPPAAVVDGGPIVDEAVLEKLAADTSIEVVPKILGLYLRDAHERILNMPALLEKGELETLAFEAHALKSGSGSCGALRLQSDFMQLEAAAKAADPEAAAAALERVLATWEQAEIGLHAYLSRLLVE